MRIPSPTNLKFTQNEKRGMRHFQIQNYVVQISHSPQNEDLILVSHVEYNTSAVRSNF